MDGQKKPSWRDVFKVHPAAEVFLPIPPDELVKLGQDIQLRGLEHPIVLWAPNQEAEPMVIDGRSRLDAMELVGMETFYRTKEGAYHIKTGHHLMNAQEIRYGIDPYAFVISQNIRRRHLTKEQQADLIVKVMKMAETESSNNDGQNDFAKMARSFSPKSGKRGGSTKDPVKEKAIKEGKKHGISPRTMERAFAKDRGPARETAENRTEQSSETAGDRTGATEHRAGPKSLEEQLRASEHARRQVEARAQKEIGRLEGELRDAQKRNAAHLDTIEKLKAKNAKHQETEKELKARIRHLKDDLDSCRVSSAGYRFGGITRRPDISNLRREFAKKYHPDGNMDKKFTANEVMADINRLCDDIG